tara:strand:+ start:792 stop:1013 length:222 start_codon:yes stop_codon:yes gene_type:complete
MNQKQIVTEYINKHYCFGDREYHEGTTAAEICNFWEQDGVWHIDDHQLAGIERVKVIDGKVVSLELRSYIGAK